jgi:hypothetical protein
MKNKTILVLTATVVTFLMVTGCPHPTPIIDPVYTATVSVLVDDFSDGDNRTDTGAFGGYWYTFDDLAGKETDSQCGNSEVYPPSDAYLVKNSINVTPTFVMSSYSASLQTPPTVVTSGYYARVSGTVNRDKTTGYTYGFVGFGANLLDVAADGSKNPVDASAYTKLRFWYKNGPSLGASTTTPWKVKLGTNAPILNLSCRMEEVDDQPVKEFTSTNQWQQFSVDLLSFNNENWGNSASCSEARGTPTGCVPGFVSYIGGAKFKCTAAQALPYLTAIQWQTNFKTTSSGNTFDLMIAQVELIK